MLKIGGGKKYTLINQGNYIYLLFNKIRQLNQTNHPNSVTMFLFPLKKTAKVLFPFLFFIIASISFPLAAADKIVSVHGKYSYYVGDDENVTLKEAKMKCIELAKAEAIKAAFGEFVTSDIISTNIINGADASNYYWQNTVARAKGDWLGDERPPVVSVDYANGDFMFTAEVWGQAREITQANTQLQWAIQTDRNDLRQNVEEFRPGERIYVNFTSPADGYVAIYLIEGSDDTSCLLPYRHDTSGRYRIRGGKNYTFFDKEQDAEALNYRMNTSQPEEFNQVVVIYSPNPFTKCTDVSANGLRPNSLTTADFQKWLLKCQRADKDMVVNKKWIKIRNN